ncbi:MAG: methionine adenosyltransferase [Stellaceae bacterium]
MPQPDRRTEIRTLPGADVASVEIVERKGTGHPDTICDALAEAASQALCHLYRDSAGMILHHNVDKVLLRGGEARPTFGGGQVIAPIEIFLAGRATRRFRGTDLPIDQRVEQACRSWLHNHLRYLDADAHVRLHLLLRPSSDALVELFLRRQGAGVALANDTSCGVGYAPLSPLERAVYAVERHLNGPGLKAAHPEVGEDIKVMGVRRHHASHLTVALAFVDAQIGNVEDYLAKKAALRDEATAVAGKFLGSQVSVEINTADAPPDSLYLTVTGTSAEAGDDGEAGRGNRANGLITPYRPMTMESVAGKNPVNHVGKLYSLAAGLIVDDIIRVVDEVTAAECYLVSQIGQPIDQPGIVDLRVRPAPGASVARLRPRIEEIAGAQLKRIGNFADDLLEGRIGFDRWPLRTPMEADGAATVALSVR